MAADRDRIVALTDRRVDLARELVLFPDGRANALTTREAQLLGYLAERAERDVSRDELLDAVWQYRATFATRAVDVTMRRLRTKVEPDPQSPVHLISVHGVGYRFVPPRAVEVLPPPAPAARTNVPPERTSFVGRERAIADLEGLLAGGARLVSILGPGGIGKSRLAARVAARSERPAWWCDLEPAEGEGGVVAAVAAALGVALTDGTDLGRALAGRGPVLLVLDGFERHAASARATVGRWLSEAPEAAFVVTSRERLRLEGERLVELEPLDRDEARALFLDRLSAAGAPAPRDAAAVDRLVERLDRLPLAIELAAPRARVLSLDQLEERLDRELLSAAGRDGRALGAVLDGSWELLDEPERRALAWCATFVGGFTLEAAEAVLGDADRWAVDLVEALRDKSLLRLLDGPEPRLGLYESVRDYALGRLDERGERDAAEAAHAAFHLALGEELAGGLDRPGGLARMHRLAAEAGNLLAVARRATGRDLVRATLILDPLLSTRGPTSRLRELLEPALAVAEDDDRARLLLARGRLRRLAADMDGARGDVAEALALVRGRGSRSEAQALAMLALLDTDASRLDEAEAHASAALVVARAGRHRVDEGVLLGMIGALATMRGRAEEAERRYLDAIRVHGEVGNERRLALDLGNLALLLSDAGRLAEAEDRLLQALEINTAWGDTRRTATTHGSLATLRANQGRTADAVAHAEEALRFFREEGYTRFAAIARQTLASLRWSLGSASEALPIMREATRELAEVGDRLSVGIVRAWTGAALASAGDVEAGAAELEAARATLAPHRNPQADAAVLVASGFLDHARGDDDLARAKAEEGRRSSFTAARFLAGLLARELG